MIDPSKRAAEVYTAPDEVTAIPAGGTLDSGDVLPGFTLPLAAPFVDFPAVPAKKPIGKKKK